MVMLSIFPSLLSAPLEAVTLGPQSLLKDSAHQELVRRALTPADSDSGSDDDMPALEDPPPGPSGGRHERRQWMDEWRLSSLDDNENSKKILLTEEELREFQRNQKLKEDEITEEEAETDQLEPEPVKAKATKRDDCEGCSGISTQSGEASKPSGGRCVGQTHKDDFKSELSEFEKDLKEKLASERRPLENIVMRILHDGRMSTEQKVTEEGFEFKALKPWPSNTDPKRIRKFKAQTLVGWTSEDKFVLAPLDTPSNFQKAIVVRKPDDLQDDVCFQLVSYLGSSKTIEAQFSTLKRDQDLVMIKVDLERQLRNKNQESLKTLMAAAMILYKNNAYETKLVIDGVQKDFTAKHNSFFFRLVPTGKIAQLSSLPDEQFKTVCREFLTAGLYADQTSVTFYDKAGPNKSGFTDTIESRLVEFQPNKECDENKKCWSNVNEKNIVLLHENDPEKYDSIFFQKKTNMD